MSNMGPEHEFLSPRTPPSRNIGDPELELGQVDGAEGLADDASSSGSKGRRRHRRAKGRKRKQNSSLMITNADGSDFSGEFPPAEKQVKIALRPTNNPLLNAPKNSTQFIIDDHENSNLFWNFETQEPFELVPDDEQGDPALAGQMVGSTARAYDRCSPDDESFWTQYSERDFEVVYETAHQEEIFGWEKERIIREIAAMEKRQQQLIEMLAAVDPITYLEKLQEELLSLQEVNRELKLVNIAEKLHRQERLERGEVEDSDSDSRLPDSTSQEGGAEDGARERDDSSDEEGGCLSGCCLLNPGELEQDQLLVDEEEDDQLLVEEDDKDNQLLVEEEEKDNQLLVEEEEKDNQLLVEEEEKDNQLLVEEDKFTGSAKKDDDKENKTEKCGETKDLVETEDYSNQIICERDNPIKSTLETAVEERLEGLDPSEDTAVVTREGVAVEIRTSEAIEAGEIRTCEAIEAGEIRTCEAVEAGEIRTSETVEARTSGAGDTRTSETSELVHASQE